MDVAGQDATEAFEDVGHSDEAREILRGLMLGELKRVVILSFLLTFPSAVQTRLTVFHPYLYTFRSIASCIYHPFLLSFLSSIIFPPILCLSIKFRAASIPTSSPIHSNLFHHFSQYPPCHPTNRGCPNPIRNSSLGPPKNTY